MVNNETSKTVHTTVANQQAWYPVGFDYFTNDLNQPELRVTLDGTVLTYMTDYITDWQGIQLVNAPEAGKSLAIERNIGFVQDIQFRVGLIDPEHIEKGFDLSVQRDQMLRDDINALDSRTTSLEGRMTTAEADIDSLEDRVTTNEADIADLKTVKARVEKNEEDIADLQEDKVSKSNQATIVYGRAGGAETDYVPTDSYDNGGSVTHLVTSKGLSRSFATPLGEDNVGASMADLGVVNDALQEQITNNDNDIAEHRATLADLQEQITSNDTDIANLENAKATRTELSEGLDLKLDKDQGVINNGKVLAVGPNGQVDLIEIDAGGLLAVTHDESLDGEGTTGSPLKLSDEMKQTIAGHTTSIAANADAISAETTRATDAEETLDAKIETLSGEVAANQDDITTNRNDIAGLGEQVATMESKIPGDASAANQLATQVDVDRAAESGSNRGGYFFGKTKTDTVAPNPTSIQHNYFDFTTNIPYTAKADLSGWDAGEPFVAPSDIDCNIQITSKFWDVLDTDNTGGIAYWSHVDRSWTYRPWVGLFDSPVLTGSPTTPTPTFAEMIANKAYIDAIVDALVPAGTIITSAATSSTMAGYLPCNGQAVSRTTYARLFAKIGTTYGEGDGSSTFNVPNTPRQLIRRQTSTTWYNVYSDGYVEQGGQLSATTTFPIKMANTNYTVVMGNTSGTYEQIRFKNRTVTTVKFDNANGTPAVGFYVIKGYADSSEYAKSKWNYGLAPKQYFIKF